MEMEKFYVAPEVECTWWWYGMGINKQINN